MMKNPPFTDTQIGNNVLGWHDSHGASAALLAADGTLLYAAAEERFTKRKLQKGYPRLALADLASRFGSEHAVRCYPDLPLGAKVQRHLELQGSTWRHGRNGGKSVAKLAGIFFNQVIRPRPAISVQDVAFRSSPVGSGSHTCEHHRAHAASAFYLSGFQRAYVVTVDGVGDCLSGTISIGNGGQLTLQKSLFYNELTVGADYETFTAMLGFNPDRHCGKITGLAAYGRHKDDCVTAVEHFFRDSWRRGRQNYFDRMHDSRSEATIEELRSLRHSLWGAFSNEDLAFAIQYLSEQRIVELIRAHVPEIAGSDLALAGGVFANVRINQKVKELGFRSVFVQPAMDDTGLSLGAALDCVAHNSSLTPTALPHMFLGPGFEEAEIAEALEAADVAHERVENLASAVAKLVADGQVVGRFDGRMEFGPRALGNRSILYDTRDPSVNQWLNRRLNRTDFMPFAPATLEEHAERCYHGLEGCRHTAEFMTITFPCTEFMQRTSPAVVHVDGTARAQIVTQRANPGFHEILEAYYQLTGIPSLVNTSFNMHESPIVNTPEDAIQTFLEGKLDYLAIGPFLAKAAEPSAIRPHVQDRRTEPAAALVS